MMVSAQMMLERAAGLSSRQFHLIVMPTEKCNFRCTYCYEDFAIGRMKPAIADGLLRLLASRIPELDQLHIGWFGGEPTLAADIIERVNTGVKSLMHDGMTFTSSISTNGWLLDRDMFERLVQSSVRTYQISIDGAGHEHDRTRITRKKAGTFDRIIQNIASALQTNHTFKIAIRLHVRESTLASARTFIDDAVERFQKDPRLTIYIKPVEQLGSAGDGNIDVVKDRAGLKELKQYLRATGLHEGSAEPAHCYAAMANSLIVRADGRIAKCTVAFNDIRNTVGFLAEDGRLHVDHARFRPWIRGLFSGDPAELSCPLHNLAAADH